MSKTFLTLIVLLLPAFAISQTILFTDDFEGNIPWTTDSVGNHWEHGIPAMSNINTAHSPINVWAIDLDSTYENGIDDYLYSPIIICTGIDSARIRFWHYFNTQAVSSITGDGGSIQISKNNGSWVSLGFMGDPNATNWYNGQSAGTHYWSGNSNGWIESSYKLDFTSSSSLVFNADSIQIRYYFHSDNSINNYDGWAIDDFSVEVPFLLVDAGVTAINTPIDSSQIGSTVMLDITIKNFGTDSLFSIPVGYTYNGITVNEMVNIPSPGLLTDSSYNYTFTTPFSAPNSDYNICAYTALPNDMYASNDSYCKQIISTPAPIDIAVVSMKVNPNWGVDTTRMPEDDTVYVSVVNKGTTTMTSFILTYDVAQNTKETSNWAGSLAAGDTLKYKFSKTFKCPINWYPVCVEAIATGDADPLNNKLCKNYFGINYPPIGAINYPSGLTFSVNQNQPNPTNGITYISYVIPMPGKVSFVIQNGIGQIIQVEEFSKPIGEHTYIVDVSQFASGVYYYTVKYDNQNITKKFVVNN